jgi:hypothetical protein
MIVIITTMIIDSSFIRLYTFGSLNQFINNVRFSVFLAVGIISIIGQVLVLNIVKNRSNATIRARKVLHLSTIHKLVSSVQYCLIILFAALLTEIIATSVYSIVAVTLMTEISYLLAVIMMSILSYQFFSWFRTNKDSLVLLYGLSAGMVAINLALTSTFVALVLNGFPSYVPAHQGMQFAPFIPPGSIIKSLNYAFQVSSVLSFMLMWIATVMLLNKYSQKWGKTKFYIIITIPLGYFLAQFLPLFPNLMSMLPLSSPFFIFYVYTLIFSLSKPIGGILFGIAFLSIARNFDKANIVKTYMIACAYGLVLLFTSDQSIILVYVPYPPFGMASILFEGLASYIVLIGIYSSAVSMAQDIKLRTLIRDVAVKFLDLIGTAQMEQEIIRNVTGVVSKFRSNIIEKSGIESSVDEENIKNYIKDVVEQLKSEKENKDSS